MKEKKIVLSAEILSINEEAHPDYMTLDLGVISNNRNLNGVLFTDRFLDNASSSIIDMPLQVDKAELEAGNYENLTHKYDGVNLNTDSIGTFVDWRIDESNGNKVLIATSKVWKRYPKVVNAIIELHGEGLLRASVEAAVTEYEDINQTEYDAYDGRIIGHTLVSSPAEVRASSRMLIAEALNNDLEKIKEEEQMDKELKALQEQLETLGNEVASLNEKLSNESEQKASLEAVIAEKESKILEMSEEIIDLNDKIKLSEKSVVETKQELETLNSELNSYKEVEIAEQKEELKAMAEKHLGEELSDEVKMAIEELDEKAIKVAIAEALMAKDTENENSEDDVVIASEEEKKSIDIFNE